MLGKSINFRWKQLFIYGDIGAKFGIKANLSVRFIF